MKYYDDLLQMKIFHYDDIVKLTGNDNTAKSVLRQYTQKGYIALIKKGLYVAINIVDKEPVSNKFAIASQLTPSSFVSHHSAFEYYGYANQVSYDVTVTSEERITPFEYNGRYYRRIAPSIKSGIIKQSDGVWVSDIERTVLDCINLFEKNMGFEELINCISAVPMLNEQILLKYLWEYDKNFLYQKTGFILEHFKKDLDLSEGFFEICKTKSGKSSRYLLKDIDKSSAETCSKWRLTIPPNIWNNMMNGGYDNADI